MVLNKEKRTHTLLFVVDTSRNTMGGVIDAINRAIESVISSIKNAIDKCPELNVQFKVAILEFFGESATISTPEDITSYKWKNLEANTCGAKFSLACKKLNDVLTNDGGNADDSYLAIILIVSDDIDIDGYVALNKLEGNPRFKQAYKMAIYDGNVKDKKMLEKFTGIDVNVLSASMTPVLYSRIRKMSFRAAQFGLEYEKSFQQLLNKAMEECD